MGLDMYLYRANLHDYSVEQAKHIENFLDWQKEMSDHPDRTCTMKEWCGQDDKDINPEALDALTPEFQLRYYYWDTNRRHGHYRIFQNCGYWRKANAIHAWFVENVQNGVDDCAMYEVTYDQLESLKIACLQVLSATPEEYAAILPTQGGFFFGSTDYDEDYLEEIQNTIRMIDTVLAETDWEKETVIYSSSW